MSNEIKTPYLFSIVLAALMLVQSILGLLFQEQYRDADWIKATWFGNDWITLTLAMPLLIVGIIMANRGSIRGQLLWLGVLGYIFYNYAYYLFGAAFNAFFPLYVVILVLSVPTLIRALSRIDVAQVAAGFRAKTPVRFIGGYLVFVAVGLSLVWFGMWAAYIFAGRPTPVETEAFKLVAALDTAIIVPVLAIGGILLWRRNAWGYVIAGIASILSTLYLIVLSVNSFIAIQRGTADAPGEIPVWVTLALLTAMATLLLLSSVRSERL